MMIKLVKALAEDGFKMTHHSGSKTVMKKGRVTIKVRHNGKDRT
jgi:predicted RNA binding protein YcfA (HicA-like mRNA interferase family)